MTPLAVLREWVQRLRGTLTSARPDADLEDELRAHLELAVEDARRGSDAAEEAARTRRSRQGSVTHAMAAVRQQRGVPWLDDVARDVRYAVRSLRRAPGFAAVIVLTLAVAIGMNTAVFSVFNAVVLRPLGYPDADRLVWVSTVGPEGGSGFVTGPDFVEWRDRAASFDRMAAYGTADYTLTSLQGTTRVRTADVTDDFWSLSGATPAAGRLPRPGEREAVLLSHAFAQRWFAGDPDLIGRPMTLNGRQSTVVGILPNQFRLHVPVSAGPGRRPKDVDIYQPMTVSSARRGPIQLLNVVGRLADGATFDSARAEIKAIRDHAARAQPRPFVDQRALRVVPLHDQLVGAAGYTLLMLLGAVAFVLLIACANVANLLLARASARHKEVAVRLALGAGRARILRQLFMEHLLLALLASVAGLAVASVAVAAILRIDPFAIARLTETTIDGRVLLVVLATAVLTTCLFGIAPALRLWTLDPHDALHSTTRSTSSGAATVRTRRILVVAEVALALVLLIGAGLLLKSAWRMTAHPPGFEPHRVLTAKIEFSGPRYADSRQSIQFADALLDRLRAHPGVEAASISTHGYMLSQALRVDGEPVPTPDELASKAPIVINATSAALHQVLGFRLLHGRWFSDGEPAAVVNESLARRDLPGRDPIGRRIQVSENGPLLTIVGVVADLKYSQLDAAADLEVYVPYRAIDDGLFGVRTLVRTTNDPRALGSALRSLVSDIDATQVAEDVMSLEQALGDSIAPRRLNLLLFGSFAAAALLLAATGVYGVLAYAVAQRAREIGVRMALGAQRTDIVLMVVRQGTAVMTAGIVAGLAGSLALARLMDGLLYDVRPTDPATFAVLTMALAAAGLLACCVPAFNAARVDPVRTLRCD